MDENSSLFQYLSNIVSAQPQHTAVIIKKAGLYKQYTYQDILNHSYKIAALLAKEGVKKNDRVAIILENSLEWIYIYFGIILCGAICVPLDIKMTAQEIENVLKDANSRFIFASLNTLLPETSQAVVIFTDDEKFKQVLDAPIRSGASFPKVSADDIASILYTSGTTAKPKGVCLTHKNFLADFESIYSLKLINNRDNFIALLPFHHAYAFTVTILAPLFSGATLTIPPGLNSEELTQALAETKVTFFIGVPQIFNLIHKSIFNKLKSSPLVIRASAKTLTLLSSLIKASTGINLSRILLGNIQANFGGHLRFLVSGGARLEPKITRDLLKIGFTVLEGYGLTETAPIVSLNLPEKIKPGSVGKAIPNVKIKIVGPEDHAKDIAQGETGEVAIKGNNVMLGYFNNPRLSAEVLKDGWFYSGDLGYFDRDGYLFLTGRKKEVIVLSSGKNIFPEELEDYYSQSPYIKEICVFEKRQKKLGSWVESIEAIIIPNLEYFKQTGEINVQAKIHWVLENLSHNLPSYKRIMGFIVSKEPLPRTHLGKIKRYEVKNHYADKEAAKEEHKYSEEDLQILAKEPAKSIIDCLQKELKRKISLDDHVELDLGLDSISRVELALSLEKVLGIAISEESMASIFTIRELIAEISKIMAKEKKSLPAEQISLGWAETIKTTPDTQTLRKIKLKPDIYDKFINLIFKQILNIAFRIFWLLRVKGKNNLACKKSYILCPNHASFLDGLFIYSSLSLKSSFKTYFVGYSQFFEQWISSWVVRPFRIIPIDPASNLTLSLQTAAYLLRNNKSLCIFPEGSRSINEEINEFKKGVAILGLELGIPLVPVYIKGSHYSWPRSSRLPRFHPITVIIGEPKQPEELLKIGKALGITDDYEAVAVALRKEVLTLSTN